MILLGSGRYLGGAQAEVLNYLYSAGFPLPRQVLGGGAPNNVEMPAAKLENLRRLCTVKVT